MATRRTRARSAQSYLLFRARGKPLESSQQFEAMKGKGSWVEGRTHRNAFTMPAGITTRPSQTWIGANFVVSSVCL